MATKSQSPPPPSLPNLQYIDKVHGKPWSHHGLPLRGKFPIERTSWHVDINHGRLGAYRLLRESTHSGVLFRVCEGWDQHSLVPNV